MKVEFFVHNVDESDAANVVEALRGRFLTTGERVARFERDLAAFTGRRLAVGLTSGTAALHLALAAAGVGPGDEVITTPMSFVASANAVIMAGARPVFVDVESDAGNIDARLIDAAVTARTKAILPVHLYGTMCDMRAVKDVARRRGLKIIEDAAHALESRRDGVSPGELSDAAALSFYATKSITSGEGGAVVTDDAGIADLVRTMRLHGLSKTAADRYADAYSHYDMEVFGWKYNMSDIQAALLVGQLPRVEAMRRRREEIAMRYREAFGGVPGLSMPSLPGAAVCAHHLFTVRVDPRRRDEVISRLNGKGIGVAVNYRPIHLMSYYRAKFGYSEGAFPAAERIGASTISLPLYPKLTDGEVGYVVDAVRAALKG